MVRCVSFRVTSWFLPLRLRMKRPCQPVARLTLDAGKGSTSVEIKVNFVRPIFEKTGTLRAVGETINVGRQIASAEGKLIDDDGKLYAHGTTTCFIFDL